MGVLDARWVLGVLKAVGALGVLGVAGVLGVLQVTKLVLQRSLLGLQIPDSGAIVSELTRGWVGLAGW